HPRLHYHRSTRTPPPPSPPLPYTTRFRSTLSSSDPTKVGVPASITVAAGDTFADFPVSGLALTTSPVTISAAAPGWLTGTYSVTDRTSTRLNSSDGSTSCTTLCSEHTIAR